jgi:hypothetical protein
MRLRSYYPVPVVPMLKVKAIMFVLTDSRALKSTQYLHHWNVGVKGITPTDILTGLPNSSSICS